MIPEGKIVYGHPVLQNITNSAQKPELSRIDDKKFRLWCFCAILLLIFIISVAVILSLNIPKVDVDDVTLTRFMLSPINNTLYYYLVVGKMTFINPYSFVGLQFDKIDADLMYQGQQLGTKEITPDDDDDVVFYLPPHTKKSIENVVLRGERVLQLIHGDEKLVYESQSKIGVYKIGVKVRIVVSSFAMWLFTEQDTYEISRKNLEVPLSSAAQISSAI
ncbi:putative syntaxin-24 [Rutidosis leptorrhynchoides]|uniref:putative syntaxin-24 n=1 Tax=Rutidosis leptorrhynchoides TaxID=125765 RepID=UPI003A9A5AD0